MVNPNSPSIQGILAICDGARKLFGGKDSDLYLESESRYDELMDSLYGDSIQIKSGKRAQMKIASLCF